MSGDDPTDDSTPLSPEAAFAILGDETRLAILRELGEAGEPLSFSTLRERVGYDTASNFSYHLDAFEGHYLRETEEGYALRETGRRVIEAVLSGAVTGGPRTELMRVDRNCPYCGAPVEMRYDRNRIEGYCTDCGGVYEGSDGDDSDGAARRGYLGHLPFPPAGIEDRTLPEAERAAWTWGARDFIAVSKGVCPRCAARLEQTPSVCEAHEPGRGRCETCGNRHRVQVHSSCTHCIYEETSSFVLKLFAEPAFLGFLTSHGLDPVVDNWEFGWGYEEDIRSTDPFEAAFTFSLAGDRLILTVDDEMQVVDASEA